MRKGSASARTPSLDERFQFDEDPVVVGDPRSLRASLFEVIDRKTGQEFCLKLWRKSGTPADADLRELWRHEMRQVQRVMAYAGARDVIVDVADFVEDSENFGVLHERVGRPLSVRRLRVPRQHWLKNLAGPRPRVLLWRNISRLATALSIIHAQGLVHGQIAADAVFTEGADEPDFKLGGFEWSLWIRADSSDAAHANVGPHGAARRASLYSFAEDWRALGEMIAELLGLQVKASGDLASTGRSANAISPTLPERLLLKRLVAPSRRDAVDAESIVRAIDDILMDLGRSGTIRPGSFILMFLPSSRLAQAVHRITGGQIAVDQIREQLQFVRTDLDAGMSLLVPRNFNAATSRMRLLTKEAIYQLHAFVDEGTGIWDIAVCDKVSVRGEAFFPGDDIEHEPKQPIVVAEGHRDARRHRSTLGPDALDWSSFAVAAQPNSMSEHDRVRKALLLVQTVEAVAKTLEVYPVEILSTERVDGRQYATLRAHPSSRQDHLAKRMKIPDAGDSLRRLFDEDQRHQDSAWRLSLSPSLGASRSRDVAATFVDIVKHNGKRAYQFSLLDTVDADARYFLRSEDEIGTEQVIRRRLRNLAFLETRTDVLDALSDLWTIRRSSREALDETDKAFGKLDKTKQEALRALWDALPTFLVVGPPGVGKTYLATEVIRRRFVTDKSTRILLSAQGHDALDNLQREVRKVLTDSGIRDVIIIRSTTPDRRPTTDEDVNRMAAQYLESLERSTAFRDATAEMQGRIKLLRMAASGRGGPLDRSERQGLRALSNLILDAANIVISTANSGEVERLVESREQFDWVIVEEAAKATGPELVAPLMLSGRHLLIGDHHQLPPFDADRFIAILEDHELLADLLRSAEDLVGPIFREGELGELTDLLKEEPASLSATADLALRLVLPFKTIANDDERRRLSSAAYRPVAVTLEEQRRMDPAIARIVSDTFYRSKLITTEDRTAKALSAKPPFTVLRPLPDSPIVIVDFKHVSHSGKERPAEYPKPRWHNPGEVDAVVDVLRHVRAAPENDPDGESPTLAVLSPYTAQVLKIRERVESLQTSRLAHLKQFLPVRPDHDVIGTVDSFQGSEADIVIISLVRNNPGAGASALGFLRDPRRMNVLLSRAKWKLILVTSLSFLDEAVKGVNPDKHQDHKLEFISTITATIRNLTAESRNGVPLAALISPDSLRGGT